MSESVPKIRGIYAFYFRKNENNEDFCMAVVLQDFGLHRMGDLDLKVKMIMG